MKTNRTKKDLAWYLDYQMHEAQKRARRSQHKKIQALKKNDMDRVSYFEEQRDIYRDTAELLAHILREKPHHPKDIIFLAKLSREEGV